MSSSAGLEVTSPGRGRFITIEGVEGVGKSTNIEMMMDVIRETGIEVVVTREPGGTATGERIRAILLDRNEDRISAMTELLLMFAARAQHVEEVIEPALARGAWVISDRFTDSSYAYQGGGRGLGNEPVAILERQVLGDFRPDLVIVLDLDVRAGLERAAEVAVADRFESEERAFFERVRQVFIERAKQPGYCLVDASRSIEAVQADVRDALSFLLPSAQ